MRQHTGCMEEQERAGIMPVDHAATRSERTHLFIVDDYPIVRQGLAQMINQEVDLTVCGEADDV
jgi:hypothetical protein